MLCFQCRQNQSLVRELRSHMPHSMPPTLQKKPWNNRTITFVQWKEWIWTQTLHPLQKLTLCFLFDQGFWVCRGRSVSHWVVGHSVSLFETPWTVAHQAPLSMNSPGRNTGVSSHALLQRIFPNQGLKPGLLHCRQILYCLSHQGSPLH